LKITGKKEKTKYYLTKNTWNTKKGSMQCSFINFWKVGWG